MVEYEAYNCGGFALDTLDWFFPYTDIGGREEDAFNLYMSGAAAEDIRDLFLQRDIQFMLHKFKGRLVQINDLSEAKPTDRVICYRVAVGIDTENFDDDIFVSTDFHFKVRINGQWFEKIGEDAPTLCDLDADSEWYLNYNIIYDSANAFFILKSE